MTFEVKLGYYEPDVALIFFSLFHIRVENLTFLATHSLADLDSSMKKIFSRWKKGLNTQLSEKEKCEALDFARDQFHVSHFEDRNHLFESADLKLNKDRFPEDYLILASKAYRSEDSLIALEHAFAGLALEPKDNRVRAALHNRLGTTFKANGATELALENFNSAASLDPNNPDPLCHLGELYYNQRRFEEAEAKLIAAVQIDPMNPDYHFHLGRIMLARKLYSRAETELQEAGRLDPSRKDIWMSLASVYLEQKKFHNSLEPLERALELIPDDPEPHIQLGRAQFKLKNLTLAEEHFKEAKQFDSQNANICNLLGDVFFDQKRFFQAESEYLQATKLCPTHASAHKNLGHVYLEQKRYEQAEKYFQESIRLDPASVVPLINIRIQPKFETDQLPLNYKTGDSA